MSQNYFCKLNGKQSVTIPISLTRNGETISTPTNIIVSGIVVFSDILPGSGETVSYESVLPVLFESKQITVLNGEGSITLLPRSEDFVES